jgi:uncharacterized membrane protein YcjF (UPF0283 family)
MRSASFVLPLLIVLWRQTDWLGYAMAIVGVAVIWFLCQVVVSFCVLILVLHHFGAAAFRR